MFSITVYVHVLSAVSAHRRLCSRTLAISAASSFPHSDLQDIWHIYSFCLSPIFGTKNQQPVVLVQQLVWGVLRGIALCSLIRSQSLNRDVNWCHSDSVGFVWDLLPLTPDQFLWALAPIEWNP